MSFKLKNKKQLKAVFLFSVALLVLIVLVFGRTGENFHHYDFKCLDFFYKRVVQKGLGPSPGFNPQIVYLTINDETYDYFDKNHLDRSDLARVNNALHTLDIEAVVYDIIFARASVPPSDEAFKASLHNLGRVYLPTAMELSPLPTPFRWKQDPSHDRLVEDYLARPVDKTTQPAIVPTPFHAVKALMQYPDFAAAVYGSGDISALADTDGIYRHAIMLVKVDDQYFPTLSLSIFMDWAGVSLEDLMIRWGNSITIPASKENYLEKDVVIPIDFSGRTYIPFVDRMGSDFRQMPVHTFLEFYSDADMEGNLLTFFEGAFVFIADVAVGTSDLGHTPLEADVPLVNIHTSLLNAMFTGTFYSRWSSRQTLMIICLVSVCLVLSATFRRPFLLYFTGLGFLVGIFFLTRYEFIHFHLFPVATVSAVILFVVFALTITLESVVAKDRAFIRNTFARYVPGSVVNTLLADPDMIKLGGEERMVTVLFSDIAGFTGISEKMQPKALVKLLNEYFTAMADIIIRHGGIIDKFQGDAVMAEFGIPVPMENHAEHAVDAALDMLERLAGLRQVWKKKGLPELHCRIGINTNRMIVGNMGSDRALDYTVIGDAVNLASRLEGANKRYGTALIISEFTRNYLSSEKYLTRILDYVKVKGKKDPVKIYEVYGKGAEHGDVLARKTVNGPGGRIREPGKTENQYYVNYHEGFNAYLNRDFPGAEALFLKALAQVPGDRASIEMLKRIDIASSGSLGPEWDGSFVMSSK